MENWEPDEPIRLGNGLLICRTHGRVVCMKYCVDYSFLLDCGSGGEDSNEGPKREDPNYAIELGNGRLVCSAHGREVCRKCDADYSFLLGCDSGEEDSNEGPKREDLNEKDLGGPKPVTASARDDHNKQSGKDEVVTEKPVSYGYKSPLQYRSNGTLIVPDIRVFKTRPATTTAPQALFPIGHNRQFPRYVHQKRRGDFLIYTDGACLNNGQPNPAAGWGFVFRDPEAGLPRQGTVRGRLEKEGPSDSSEEYTQTSNRAELRAVIAAFQFRSWPSEGWERLVIATDSAYVTKGATQWVHTWGRNGWKTSKGAAVKNRDLWEELLQGVLGFRRDGMEVSFWKIPRNWNTKADQAAKEGAKMEERQKFANIMGMLQ